MHTPVNGSPAPRKPAWAALCAALVLLLSAQGALAQGFEASEEEEERRYDDRWVPSFAIISGISWFEQKAAVESTESFNDRTNGGAFVERPLRDDDTGKKDAVTPYVGFNLELMTPAVEPGEPRLFANFEFLPSFGVALDVAKEGNPKQILRPDGIQNPSTECPLGFGCYNEAEIQGVGSKTTAEIQPAVFGLGFGVSFPFELLGRKIHIKPSMGWLHYRVKVDGKVNASQKPVQGLPEVRDIELSGRKQQRFHAIGPGIEIELDTGRQGPIEPSIFFDAHGYRVLGDRRVRISDSETITGCTEEAGFCGTTLFGTDIFDSNFTATYDADWRWKADPWIYRFGIGMRFRWVGWD